MTGSGCLLWIILISVGLGFLALADDSWKAFMFFSIACFSYLILQFVDPDNDFLKGLRRRRHHIMPILGAIFAVVAIITRSHQVSAKADLHRVVARSLAEKNLPELIQQLSSVPPERRQQILKSEDREQISSLFRERLAASDCAPEVLSNALTFLNGYVTGYGNTYYSEPCFEQDAGSLVYDIAQQRIIAPFEAEIASIIQSHAESSSPEGNVPLSFPRKARVYRMVTESLDTFTNTAFHADSGWDDILRGRSMTDVQCILSNMEAIAVIVTSRERVGTYVSEGLVDREVVGAYQICWEVYLVDTKRGLLVASTRLVGSNPPSSVKTRYQQAVVSGNSGQIPEDQYRSWLKQIIADSRDQ